MKSNTNIIPRNGAPAIIQGLYLPIFVFVLSTIIPINGSVNASTSLATINTSPAIAGEIPRILV